VGAGQQQFGYERIVPHRFAINPNLSIRARRNQTVQLQFPRDHRLREIAFADKIRRHENFMNRFIAEEKSRVAQARLLFPKSTFNIGKKVTALNFARVSPSRGARIRIHG